MNIFLKNALCFIFLGNIYSLFAKEEDILFLLGKYNLENRPDFININKLGIPVDKENLYLQKEVAYQLLKLYKQLKNDHPDIKFYISSATRTYSHQKNIWEKKWKKLLKEGKKDKKEILLTILDFSAMPGTSRHHWGTDFDINILENEYYEKGEGYIIYEWLKKNAKKFGFCMPYNKDRLEGYQLEKWHWSYYKIAENYRKKWNEFYKKNKIYSYLDFTGNEFFNEYAYKYVNSINPECIIDNK